MACGYAVPGLAYTETEDISVLVRNTAAFSLTVP